MFWKLSKLIIWLFRFEQDKVQTTKRRSALKDIALTVWSSHTRRPGMRRTRKRPSHGGCVEQTQTGKTGLTIFFGPRIAICRSGNVSGFRDFIDFRRFLWYFRILLSFYNPQIRYCWPQNHPMHHCGSRACCSVRAFLSLTIFFGAENNGS